MPNDMPDARAVNEALRRARELHMRSRPQETTANDTSVPDPPPSESPQEPPAPDPKTGGEDAPGSIFEDRERLLLLLLLALLAGENAGDDLLFAVLYLLL